MTTMTQWMPARVDPTAARIELDHPVVDDYLELVRARCRPNTLLATAYDLKVFFTVGRQGAVGGDDGRRVAVRQAATLAAVEQRGAPRRRWVGDGVVDDQATPVDGVGSIRLSRRAWRRRR